MKLDFSHHNRREKLPAEAVRLLCEVLQEDAATLYQLSHLKLQTTTWGEFSLLRGRGLYKKLHVERVGLSCIIIP